MILIAIFITYIMSADYKFEKNMFINDRSSLIFIEQCYDCMTKTRKFHIVTYKNIEYIKYSYIYAYKYKEHKKIFLLIISNLWYELFKKEDKFIKNRFLLDIEKNDEFLEIYDDQVLQFFAKFNNDDFSYFLDNFIIISKYQKYLLNDTKFNTKEKYYYLKKNLDLKIANYLKFEQFFPDMLKLLQILYRSKQNSLFKSFMSKLKLRWRK